MRTLKKTLSLVLALAMILGVCTFFAAADFSDADDIVYEEAVNVMTDIGIIEGKPGGVFDPEGTLTRAEAAKIIAYMLQKQDIKASSLFDDVKGTWAESFIAYCAAQGIVNGVGDNKFDPTGILTGFQFAKMLFGAVGYNSEAEGMVGDNWEIGVAVLVKATGIATGIKGFDGTNPISRDEACELALRAMELPTKKYVNSTKVEGTDILVTIGGRYEVPDGDSLLEQYEVEKTTAAEGGKNWFAAPGTLYERYDSKLGDDVSEFIPEEAFKTYYEDFNAKELKALDDDDVVFADGLEVYLNGVRQTKTVKDDEGNDVVVNLTAEAVAKEDYLGTVVELYDIPDNEKTVGSGIDRIVIKQALLAKVSDVSTGSKYPAQNYIVLTVCLPDGTTYDAKYNDADQKAPTTYDRLVAKFEKGDFVLAYFKDADPAKAINIGATVKAGAVKATVSSQKAGVSVTAGGATYYLATTYAEVDALTVGTEYNLYLDQNGFLMGAEKAGADVEYTYALVVDYANNTAKSDDVRNTNEEAYERIKVFNADGSVQVLDTAFYRDAKGNYHWVAEKVDGKLYSLIRYSVNSAGKVNAVELATIAAEGPTGAWVKGSAVLVRTTDKGVKRYATATTPIFVIPANAADRNVNTIKVYTGYGKLPKDVTYAPQTCFDDSYGMAVLATTGDKIEENVSAPSYAVLMGSPTESAGASGYDYTYTYDAIVNGEATTIFTLANANPGYDAYVLGTIVTDETTGSMTFTPITAAGAGKINTVKDNFYDNGSVQYFDKDTVFFKLTKNSSGLIIGMEVVEGLDTPAKYLEVYIEHADGTGTIAKPLTAVFFYDVVL